MLSVNDKDDTFVKGHDGTDDGVRAGITNTDSLKVGVTISVLPTGASTSALQTAANASLVSIDAGIPTALGQTTSANSMPVVFPSDQVVTISESIKPNQLLFEEMKVATGGVVRDGAIGTTFTNIYSYTGSGSFYGFTATLETSNIWSIRIIIDSNEILFGTDGLFIGDLDSANLYNIVGSIEKTLGLVYEGNSFRWESPSGKPVSFTTSVVIKAKVTSNTKKFKAGFVVRG